MSLLDDIQKQIDSIGFVDTEINSPGVQDYSAPISGKDEYEWYNNQLYTGGDRKLRLNEYEEMNTYALIASAIDIYADDCTQSDVNGEMVQIHSKNKAIKEELEDLFYKRICFETFAWQVVRSVCLYGDVFGELV